jgi:hypothetical protein
VVGVEDEEGVERVADDRVRLVRLGGTENIM